MDDRHLRIIVTLVVCFLLIYWGIKENAQPSLIPVVMLVLGSIFFKGSKEEDGPTPKKPVGKAKRLRKQKDEDLANPPTVHPPGDNMVGIVLI